MGPLLVVIQMSTIKLPLSFYLLWSLSFISVRGLDSLDQQGLGYKLYFCLNRIP